MKRTLLIIGLAIFLVKVFSQNYECIKTDAAYYFTDVEISTEEQQYKAIRIDSTIINNDTSSYFQFPVIGIENWQWDCYSGNWPSWIGNRIDVKEDGTTIFYNLENGPITIKSQLEVGDEWVCFNFYTGGYYKASVESLTQMTFLGMADWVKKIKFQAYDYLGNPVIHPINDMYILISQNHGLIRTINFKVFPDLIDNFWGDECHEYELCGISEPETGTQNLTIDKIFDFEVGDEFHTYQYALMWGDNYYFKNIEDIIDKEILNDTIIKYTIKRCARNHYEYSVSGYDTIHYLNDTVTLTINTNSSPDPALNKLPDKYYKDGDPDYYEYRWYNQTNDDNLGKLKKTLMDGFVSSYPHDCIEPIITDEKYYTYSHYLQGLGGPYYEYGDFGYVYSRELVYYKKETEIWGEPYNCDSLLVSQPEISFDEVSVSIAPNPMKDFTKISINLPGGHSTKIMVYNIMGKIVREELTDQMMLRKGEIQSGIYLIQFFDSGKIVGTKKLIVE